MTLTFQDYISPFVDITHFMIAVFIITRLRSNLQRNRNSNIEHIQQTIHALTKVQLDFQQTNAFVNKISSYSSKYPCSFLENYEDFKKELISKTHEQQEYSTTVPSVATHCHNCGLSVPNWFLYTNPIFSKKATLYRSESIGKNFNF